MEREERQAITGRLNYLANGLARINELLALRSSTYDEIDRAAMAAKYQEGRIRDANRTLEKAKKKRLPVITIVVIVLFVLAIANYRSNLNRDAYDLTRMFLSALLVFLALAVTVITLILKALTSAAKKENVRRAQVAIPDAQNRIAAHKDRGALLRERILPIDTQIDSVYNDIGELIKEFPPYYCYAEAVGRCAFFIENQRADSLKEALNLYEEELYRNETLAEMKKQTAIQQMTMLASIRTALNTGQIAANTKQIANNTAEIASNTAAISNKMDHLNTTVYTNVDVTVKPR